MNNRTKTGLEILQVAVVIGVLGDILLRAMPWGLNVALFNAAFAGGMIMLIRRRRPEFLTFHALALFAASKNPEVGACVRFYGGHPSVKPDLPALQAPVLALYAGNDRFATPEKARELEKQLKALGKQVEIHIYPNTDHAFFNDTRPEVYNKTAAQDAWSKTVKFFKTNLT